MHEWIAQDMAAHRETMLSAYSDQTNAGTLTGAQSSTSRKLLAWVFVTISCIFLVSCGSRPESGALAISTAKAPGAVDHEILIYTTREKDDRPNTYFNGERGEGLSYAKATISVPPAPAHKPGQIEWPSALPGDPEKEFTARSASYIADKAAMRRELDAKLMQLPKGKRDVFLFIHGYNTMFAEGLYRFTQFVHDSDYPGVPVLFTWASRGQLTDYVYDLNSALVARTALEETIRDLANSKAERIVILAHSMGNWLLMETARQAPAADLKRLSSKIEQVVLAAPDIDIDVFKDQLRALSKKARPRKPLIILVSEDDRALGISRRIAGGKARVGSYDNEAELAELGAIVVDLTKVEGTDSTNHSKFAQIAALSPELRAVLQQRDLNTYNPLEPNQIGQAGQDLGTFVASTAQIAITLPVAVLTAPITLATGGR
ncbi:alpha/beta hydrolase [Roseibium sp.]|uniref:alpha/beta hydrolase n=1 Tax=Roseibium sp. TaxID=1936156 RepID=UPI0032644771